MVFSKAGQIERVKKILDFAFIHFSTREDAERALVQFDGITVHDCNLDVTWAKPSKTHRQRLLKEKRCNQSGIDFSLLSNSPSLPNFSLPSTTNLPPMPCISNSSSQNPTSEPIELLNYICRENGWGEPEYDISCIESDVSKLFVSCVVIIPGLPSQNQKFMADNICSSPDDVKYYAASHVLRKLTGESNLGFSSTPESVPTSELNGSPFPRHCCFGEQGQAEASYFLQCAACNSDDPWLDFNPPSLLGRIACMAAVASIAEAPVFK